MDFLSVLINIVAIIAIVAAGAFVIVFISDLLISVIDGKNGIFFKRKDGVEQIGSKSIERLPDRPVVLLKQESPKEIQYNETKAIENSIPVQQVEVANIDNKESDINNDGIITGIDEDAAAKEEAEIAAKKKSKFVESKVDTVQAVVDSLEEEEIKFRQNSLKAAQDRKNNNQNNVEIDESSLVLNRNDEENNDNTDVDLDEYDDIINEINSKAIFNLSNEVQEFDKKYFDDYPVEDYSTIENLDTFEAMNLDNNEELVNEDAIILDETNEEPNVLDETNDEPIVLEEMNDNIDDETISTEENIDQVEEEVINNTTNIDNSAYLEEIEKLKRELEEAKNSNKDLKTIIDKKDVSIPVISGTVESYEAKLEILNERLHENEIALRKNKKDFIPLNKVKKTLESDKAKLTRKDAIVAKQKTTLYGVNNIGDIDQEKAKKLEADLDLLDGLRLSVAHCEEVMKNNEDRYPLLERENKFLTKENESIKSDIEEIEQIIAKLKKDNK